jgi:hypothetical protein
MLWRRLVATSPRRHVAIASEEAGACAMLLSGLLLVLLLVVLLCTTSYVQSGSVTQSLFFSTFGSRFGLTDCAHRWAIDRDRVPMGHRSQ